MTGLRMRLFQLRLQLDVGLGGPLAALRTEELVHVEWLFSFEL